MSKLCTHLAAILALFAVCSIAQADYLPTGQYQAVMHDAIGCIQLRDRINLQKELLAGDRQGFNLLATYLLRSGKCAMVAQGESVQVRAWSLQSFIAEIHLSDGRDVWVPFDTVLSRF